MNILITRHDKIGDFVLSLPMFYVVKKAYPNAKVFALVSKVNYDFAKQIPFIDEVILYEGKKTFTKIKEKQIDVSISAFIDFELGLTLFLSGIKQRIAPATKIAQIFFNKTIKQRRSRVKKTEWEYNLDLIKFFDSNIDLEFPRPLLKLDVKKEEFGFKTGDKIIALHPGSGGTSSHNISLSEYIKLAKEKIDKENAKIVFTFGPNDKKEKEFIEANIDFEAKILLPKTLYEFCRFLTICDTFISTSTGPNHLASLVNIKTITFFGKRDLDSPKRWASINEKKNQIYYELESK